VSRRLSFSFFLWHCSAKPFGGNGTVSGRDRPLLFEDWRAKGPIPFDPFLSFFGRVSLFSLVCYQFDAVRCLLLTSRVGRRNPVRHEPHAAPLLGSFFSVASFKRPFISLPCPPPPRFPTTQAGSDIFSFLSVVHIDFITLVLFYEKD